MYKTTVNFIDLTTFGKTNGQRWPFLVISFSLFGKYYIYTSFGSSWRADSEFVYHFMRLHRFDHLRSIWMVKVDHLWSCNWVLSKTGIAKFINFRGQNCFSISNLLKLSIKTMEIQIQIWFYNHHFKKLKFQNAKMKYYETIDFNQ